MVLILRKWDRFLEKDRFVGKMVFVVKELNKKHEKLFGIDKIKYE